MRIVYYTHTAFFDVALSLIRALAREAEVHLLVEISPGAWRSAAFDIDAHLLPAGLVPGDATLAGHFPDAVREHWRSAASFHLVSHRSRRSVHPASWRVSKAALDFAASLGPDLLHVDDVDVSPRLALALRRYRASAVVLSAHDPEPHSGEWSWRKSLSRRLAYPRADRFLLHNAALAPRFRARYGLSEGEVAVAGLGVYDILHAWATDAPVATMRPTVLFFGRLSPYKGLEVLYDAAPRIAARVPGVRFVVAGRPLPGYTPPPPPVLPAGTDFELIQDYLPNEALVRLVRTATVVACPYRDATQSGVVLTAFAFGVPVVASAVGGLPEYVVPERTGLLVPPGRAERLADAVVRILEDESLRQRLQQGIEEERRGRLGWRDVAERTLAAYRGVLG